MNQPLGVSNDGFVDRICIDLIRRRRASESVSVLDYIKQFPQLADDESLLDLIDAEFCVNEELGVPSATDQMIAQFPNLQKQIEQLANLTDQFPSFVPVGQLNLSQGNETGIGDVNHHSLPAQSLRGLPDWLTVGSCISESSSTALYRGRDARNASPLAIKILRSPQPITVDCRERLLDHCETCASVNHARWTSPMLATVQESHFAVVRPWCFGSSLRKRIDAPIHIRDFLAHFSTIAFAVASAHGCGAFHGGIHDGNVIIDHRNAWQLVDAASNLSGFQPDDSTHATSELLKRDIDALIRIVESTLLTINTDESESMLVQLRLNIRSTNLDAADLGEVYLRLAEQQGCN